VKISKSKILFVISIVALCQPLGATALNPVYSVLKIVGLLYGLYLLASTRGKLGLFNICILLFWITMLVATVNSGTNIRIWFMQFYMYALPCIIIGHWLQRDAVFVIKALTCIFSVYLTLNLITFFQNGVDEARGSADQIIYWLGIRTRISDVAFLAISLAILTIAMHFRKKRYIFASILIFVSSACFIFGNSVSTGIMALVVYVVVAILMLFSAKMRKNLPMIGVFFGLLLSLFLILANGVSRFSWILEQFLGESLTLNGRTYIWASVIAQMPGHMIIGNGIGAEKNFAIIVGTTSSTHNGYLDILYSGGMMALVLFMIIIFIAVKNLIRSNDKLVISILGAMVFAMGVVMISEVANTCAYFFIMLVLCNGSRHIVEARYIGNIDKALYKERVC
jgi:O-antigen ligase